MKKSIINPDRKLVKSITDRSLKMYSWQPAHERSRKPCGCYKRAVSYLLLHNTTASQREDSRLSPKPATHMLSQLHSPQPKTVAHLIFPRHMSKLTVHICVTESYSVIRRQTGDWEVSQLVKHLPGKHEDSKPQLKKDGHGDTHL